MRKTFATLPFVAVALACGLTACGAKDEAESVDAAAEPAVSSAPTGGVAVPEMKPTGDMAPSFGTAPDGGAPAQPTGSAVPEMSPTGVMKPAVNPNQPSMPAAPPAK